MNVNIYVYDDVEVLDFAGPFEVFSVASRISMDKPFNVSVISESGKAVKARHGLGVIPHYSIYDCPASDVLIVPGGVHTAEMLKAPVLKRLSEMSMSAEITASVCTGVFILASAGILSTHRVTTHWEDTADLRCSFPSLDVVEGVRWIDEGRYVTSGGISAGIDMSLYLVGRLTTFEHAEKTARQMEFDWVRP